MATPHSATMMPIIIIGTRTQREHHHHTQRQPLHPHLDIL